MLLNITTTHTPATDLGYLLHKHPDKLQSVDLAIGKAHIFYPESSEERTTASLLLDIDPIDLVKGTRNLSGKGFALGQYVNDRPYVASSFMSVALAKAFSTAMNGTCSKRPELVMLKMPFEVTISVLPAPKGGVALIKQMFEPLGYQLDVKRHTLDEQFPEWGASKYYTLRMNHVITLQELLSHLYVLIPALDNDKHYYVDESEIEKLITKGKGWLAAHPHRAIIVKRYLFNLPSYSRKATALLNQELGIEATEEIEVSQKKESLHQKRLAIVLDKLKESGAASVIDLGCGEGKLIRMMLKDRQFSKITGMDVSYQELVQCKDRLHWEDMAPRQKERLQLFQGSLTYQDDRLKGYDAAAIVEVIEHLDEHRLSSLERVVFEFAQPKTIVVTTPNRAYNVLFENMQEGALRHDDHRFEWDQKEFEAWATEIGIKYNYQVDFFPIGEVHEQVGAPTQMAIFTHGN